MRISDWSSDVCSSDLPGQPQREPHPGHGDVEGPERDLSVEEAVAEAIEQVGQERAHREGEEHAEADQDVQGAEDAPSQLVVDALEIGRASCRARVCQYV